MEKLWGWENVDWQSSVIMDLDKWETGDEFEIPVVFCTKELLELFGQRDGRAPVDSGAAEAIAKSGNDVDPYSTGVPGRRTVIHLIEQELRRRLSDGKVLTTITSESEYLSSWAAEQHPEAPRVTAKTIRNRLAGVYRAGMPTRPK